MSTPKIVADFETSLATAISVGSTSFTLASATDDDGVALPTGKYYFTVDNASNQKEYFVGTLTGTSVASVANVSRQGVETSGALRAHRVGASVIMTDFMTYKNYIDETTTAGAPDASATVKGVVEIATLAQVRAGTGVGETGAILVVSPTELDDMTTQDEKAALAGGGEFGTPSGTNKYLTQDWLPLNIVVTPSANSGTSTKNTADATGTQVIAHGLSGAPHRVSLKAISVGSAGVSTSSQGEWKTGNKYIGEVLQFAEGSGSPASDSFEISSTWIVKLPATSAAGLFDCQVATITVDATNITITWTKTGTPTGVYNFAWLAEYNSLTIG